MGLAKLHLFQILGLWRMQSKRAIAKFTIDFMIFLLPAFACVLLLVGLLVYSREVIHFEEAALIQMEHPSTIFGLAFRDDFRAFKFEATCLRQPAILALGSSRVMQFRSAMFVNGNTRFYNAGGGANNVYEVRSFLELLPLDSRPEIVIIGFDQDWFEPSNATQARTVDLSIADGATQRTISDYFTLLHLTLVDVISWQHPYNQLLEGHDPYYQTTAIGIDALTMSSGFRSDGSRLYGPALLDVRPVQIRFEEVNNRIETQGPRFQYSDFIDADAIAEVNRLLEYAKANNIQIVGFSPPYAPSIYQRMSQSGNYNYIDILNHELSTLFAAHEFMYFNATDGTSFGSDEAFFDGFHGGEGVYLRILIEMVEQNPVIFENLTDIAFLKNTEREVSRDDLIVFGNISE